MNLHDPMFLSFAGESITGRVPPSVVVDGNDGVLTAQQAGGVAHAYKLFCDAKRTMLGSYLVQHRVLLDGTRVQMTSTNGIDAVLVSPPPITGESEVTLAEIFRGVPTDTTHATGVSALGPSALWRVSSVLPAALKPTAVLEKHPGHCTWSSANFKDSGYQLVISWRGPECRYVGVPSWSATEPAFGSPADDEIIVKPGKYIWFNGKRIDTGLKRVLAACLFRPDSMNHGAVVLRVLSDVYPLPSTHGFAVYDLVVDSGASTTSLHALSRARAALFVAATHVAPSAVKTSGLSTNGDWSLLTMPHFNATGDKFCLAASLYDDTRFTGPGGYVGHIGVSADATTWVIGTYIDLTDSVNDSETVTLADTSVAGHVHVEVDIADTTDETRRALVAIDFKGDTLVHVYSEYFASGSADHPSLYDRNTAAGSLHIQMSVTSTLTENYNLVHSADGVIFASPSYVSTLTAAYDGTVIDADHDGTPESDTATGSVSSALFANVFNFFNFLGDLSKGVYGIGHEQGTTPTSSVTGSYSGANLTAVPGTHDMPLPTTETTTPERLKYDLWADGALQLSATTGSFTNAGVTPIVGSGTFNLSNEAAAYVDGSSLPSDTSTISTYNAGSVLAAGLGHLAVSNKTVVAYLGAAHGAAYVGETGFTSGLEAAIFKASDGTWSLGAVPAYAPGAYPTISWPVFTGLARVT